MNKNLIVVLYFSLAAVGVIILGLVTIMTPDQVDKTVGWLVQVLGLASTAAVTIYLLGTQSKDLAEVKAQTNGTNTALREENARLQDQIKSLIVQAPSKAE